MHVVRQGVVRVADCQVGIVALQGRNHAEACVLVHGGVVEDAVQERELVALGLDPFHGLGHLVQGGGAGGEDDGLAEAAEELDEGLVGDVGGGNLEDVHQRVEEAGALHVERRGQEGDALVVAAALQLLELLFPEGIVLLEELVLALRGLLGGVPVGGRVLGRERSCLVGLELEGVGAAFRSLADKALGELHAALVVDAGFGDDVGHDQLAVQSGCIEE